MRPIQAMMLTHLVSPQLAYWHLTRGVESWGYVMNGHPRNVVDAMFSLEQQIVLAVLRYNLVSTVTHVMRIIQSDTHKYVL